MNFNYCLLVYEKILNYSIIIWKIIFVFHQYLTTDQKFGIIMLNVIKTF